MRGELIIFVFLNLEWVPRATCVAKGSCGSHNAENVRKEVQVPVCAAATLDLGLGSQYYYVIVYVYIIPNPKGCGVCECVGWERPKKERGMRANKKKTKSPKLSYSLGTEGRREGRKEGSCQRWRRQKF